MSKMSKAEAVLTSVWNAFAKGNGAPGIVLLEVGQELYDDFIANAKALTRLVPDDTKAGLPSTPLCFKSSRMVIDPEAPHPWYVKISRLDVKSA